MAVYYIPQTKFDIVVGIPSYNEADSIGFVTRNVDEGLSKYFPESRSIIINVDNNSPDNTKEAFLSTPTRARKLYISTPEGVTGKGHNFYNLFRKIKEFDAKICIVVDADLKSIKPEWIKYLGEAIKNGCDFVSPLYSRHEYDGSITNHICYPLTYGLTCMNIRQPIGGEFAFSGRLAEYWLGKTWDKMAKQYGVDIFMTQTALLGGFKVCQTVLGSKIHKPSAPKLGPMFTQVVTTMFKILLNNKEKWLSHIEDVKKFPVTGDIKFESPQSVAIDYKAMKETSIYEFKINSDILKRVLERDVYNQLCKMYLRGNININSELWSRIIYDALHSFDTTNLNSSLIEALKPLYFGRCVSFIKETLDLSSIESEKIIQKQARVFFHNRKYLLKKYEEHSKKKEAIKVLVERFSPALTQLVTVPYRR